MRGMAVLVGTSGFSYKDWVGPFYPPGLSNRAWLEFYSREFPTCELNFTYYRVPDRGVLGRMATRVPRGFLFSVKAHKGITHDRDDPERIVGAMLEGITPLIEQDGFACLLLQFPHSFHANAANRDYLRKLRGWLGGVDTVVEFRSRDWISDQTFDELRRLEFGFCCVDQPLLKGLVPPIAVATSRIAYIRFHGRNSRKWWSHKEAWERYDYTYSDEELHPWVRNIRELDASSSMTLIYMNNHWQGQAVGTARQLRAMLEETGS